MKYVLITPARNEEALISKALESVTAQTFLPERWVIVDDGSADRTAQLVGDYAHRFPWIEVVRRAQRVDRNFAGKVHAFNAGLEKVRGLKFDVLGNLDADVSFEPDYLAFLMEKFTEDPKLGVAGTPFIEAGYDSARDSFEGETHVAGGCQLFRRGCFEQIGGYVPNSAGGIDWIAVTTARMMGWHTRSFLEKRFHHYRKLGTAEKGVLGSLFSYGERAYYLGWSPVYQMVRVVYRVAKKPIVLGAAALGLGFCSAALRRVKRPVSDELLRFHRKEQFAKLRLIFKTVLRFKKVDSFHVAAAPNR